MIKYLFLGLLIFFFVFLIKFYQKLKLKNQNQIKILLDDFIRQKLIMLMKFLGIFAIIFIGFISFHIFPISKYQYLKEFQQWKQQFGSMLNENQQPYRRLIFYKNLQKINEHNSDALQSYKMGINKFTIYSHEQFKAFFLFSSQLQNNYQNNKTLKQQIDLLGLGVQIDWTTRGMVSKVKDQGVCSSSWAFSATGVLQSMALINNKNILLSEQQLIDCSLTYGNKGCINGNPLAALKYVKDNGLSTEFQYPYTGRMQECKKIGGLFKIASISTAPGCAGLLGAISTRPISVLVDATNWAYYDSGILKNCPNSFNHAALLVGVLSGSWKLKNSWGVKWGQNGYIRLASGNTCGICLNGGFYSH